MASIMWLLMAPTAYLLAATLALLNFSATFVFIAGCASAVEGTALDVLVPVFKSYARFLERIFGPAHKFTPNATQVTLVALMLVVMVELGRR